MKEFFKTLWKKLFCKTSIVFIIGCILGAAGMTIDNEVIGKIVCLFGVEGC